MSKILAYFLMAFVAYGLISGTYEWFTDDKKSPPQPAPVKVETPASKVEQVAENPKPAPQNVHYKGRGFDGRSEPNYVGLNGFVAVWNDEQEYLMTNLNYTYTPWQVPTYTQDNQFWVKSDETIDHKTPIIVREQNLTYDGHSAYSGYLKVERIGDGRQFFINVRNFVVEPYWERKNPVEAVKDGVVIVTYHQRSNYYPVDIENNKVSVPDGLNLLATDLTGTYSKNGVDSSTNQIQINFTSTAVAFFNVADLTVSY